MNKAGRHYIRLENEITILHIYVKTCFQEDEMTVSSEVIDDDDEPAPSRQRENDPDWVPCDMKGKTKPESFTVTFVQREWIKPIIPAADRTDDSNDDLFYKLKDLLVGNGVDLDDVFLSPSLIGDIRREVHLATGIEIKVGCALSLSRSCSLARML